MCVIFTDLDDRITFKTSLSSSHGPVTCLGFLIKVDINLQLQPRFSDKGGH